MKRGQVGIILIVIVIIIIVVFLIFSGAIKGAISPKQKTLPDEALDLSFYKLPTQVSQGQKFDIDIIAQNKGEYEIPKETIQVVLNNAQTFNISSAVQENKEKVKSVKEGGEAEFTFPKASYVETVLSEKIPQHFTVGFCYPYQTIYAMVNNTCLAPSNTNALCEPIGEKMLHNSGAPVHLTSFKQLNSVYNTGEERIDLLVRLEFENKGSGDVYSPDASCGSLEAEDADEIKIISMKLGTEDVLDDCGTDVVSLSEGVGSIRCTIQHSPIKADATSPLVMVLDYIYKQRITGSIKVIPS